MVRNGGKLFAIILFCVLLAGGMALSTPRPGTDVLATQDAALTDLDDLTQLRDQFNQRAGVPRLILLLSPT
ncbi:MAG: hypothetical protein H0W06_02540 [Chloroflexia bacterium]|nr:hypothetical protein [Chloroflexia bacterium]